jgi:hypothetical protein
MGLTIHYGLTTDTTDVGAVRSVVKQIHQLARRLPFQEVGEVVEFQDEQCSYDDRDDNNRWLKIQAGQYVQDADNYIKVRPLHIIAFTAIPGDGCEPANFGLCRYPEFVELERPTKRRLKTNLPSFCWKSFCKTQYANAPGAGGVVNFVRCHGSIVELLDAIQKQQLAKVDVNDESHFWEHRDVRRLAETVGEWNEMVAAVAGQLKDAVNGFQVEAPITEFQNYEHLEAKGLDRLNKRHP